MNLDVIHAQRAYQHPAVTGEIRLGVDPCGIGTGIIHPVQVVPDDLGVVAGLDCRFAATGCQQSCGDCYRNKLLEHGFSPDAVILDQAS